MKYIAIIDADEKPVSYKIIGYIGNTTPYLIGATTNIQASEQELVLDKIRAEIEAIIGERGIDDYDFCSGLICARKIIDKYKAKSEE